MTKGPDLNDTLRTEGEDAVRARADRAKIFREQELEPKDIGGDRPPKIVATSFVWRDPTTIPRRSSLYGLHYFRKYTSCTVAPGALGKSSLSLVETVAIATNRPLLGIAPTEQTNVWYWNGEDPQEETERRIAAICQHYEIDGRELEGRLFVNSGRADPIKLARVSRGEIAFDDDLAADICATIKANDIGLFTIDPFISAHAVPESDNTNIDAVVKKLAHIAEETNSSVDFSHHSRKASNGQTETAAEDARGASAIINAVRSARVLNRMTKEQATEAGIAEPRSYFRADNGKANLAPPGAAKWFHLAGVQLPNGDHVAVVEPWQFPSPMDGVTTAHMRAVREMARDGDWRKDPRADSWIGRAVAEELNLNIHKPADVKKIKDVLAVWFANGVLDTTLRKDAKRRDKEFVVPGDWNEGAAGCSS
jgi:hypothetical protein